MFDVFSGTFNRRNLLFLRRLLAVDLSARSEVAFNRLTHVSLTLWSMSQDYELSAFFFDGTRFIVRLCCYLA